MSYIQKLAQIAKKELGERRTYCISNIEDKIIAGQSACEFCLCPYKNGGWQVFIQDLGRGDIYEEYHFKSEREACIKFIEITDKYYHLSKYLSEFEDMEKATS